MRVPILVFVSAVLAPRAALAGTPGLVTVVGEPPVALNLNLPASSAYKSTYDPARISIWDTATKDNLISPGQVLTAPPAPGDADGDGDFDLEDFAALQRCFTGDGGGPVGPTCQMFDADGDTDLDLTDFGVSQPSFTGPFTPLLGDLDVSGKVDLGDYATWSVCLDGPPVIVAADYDRDGDVDLADFGTWFSCLDGPGVPTGAQCQGKDLDGDNDVDLPDFSTFQALFTGDSQMPPGCGDADLDGDGDVDLADYGILQTVFGDAHPVPDVPLAVYIEGLMASTTLGDVTIDLLADPDGDGIFDLQETQAVTVVSIDISPLSGPLGTALTLTMQPAISPIVFDATTTAEWSGVFQPVVGSPSSPFTMTYSASEFRESAPGTAAVMVGEGSGLPPLPPEGAPPGTFAGSIDITLSARVLTRSLDFQVPAPAIHWFTVIYAQDELGYLDEPPTLDTTSLTEIPLYEVPPGGAVPEFVEVAFFYHTACVLRIDENLVTAAEAPASFLVDLVTFDPSGVEVGRAEDVVLTLDTGDGDPNLLTYHSDVARPVVFVEGTIDPGMFSNVIILQAAEDGFVIAVEAHP
ncbi:MAG TPA: hypothetical protein VNA25_04330 [Phycisphaerae bacterium]|nr:hypothetical protein [Phycisphaerae bacterium]